MRAVKWLAIPALSFFMIGSLPAQDHNVVETDWTGVRRNLEGAEGRALRVVLLDGRDFRATLLRVEDEGLVVRTVPAAAEWAVNPTEAKVPRARIVALQRKGRHGWGRLIGTLAGAALMAAAVAAPGKRADTVEEKRVTRGEAAVAGSLFVALGYVIGYGVDKPYPELRPAP
jgi:hypothetical protein